MSSIMSIWRRFWERNKVYTLLPLKNQSDATIEATRELLTMEFGDQHQISQDGSFVLIVGEDRNVVGHVNLHREEELTKAKALKMLELGVPRVGVEQAVAAAYYKGMNLDELLAKESESTSTSSYYIGALVVRPSCRGRGLGRAMAKASVALAVDRGATQVIALAATVELSQWYERLGANRDSSSVVGTRAKAMQRKIKVDVNHLRGNGLDDNLQQLGVPAHIHVCKGKVNNGDSDHYARRDGRSGVMQGFPEDT